MPHASNLRRVVVAAALGAIFESYDIALFGPLASLVAANFFSGLDPSSAYVFTLLSFAIAYLVRPVGAAVFGQFNDRAGRKQTFLITIVILGVSTALMGLLPSYAAIGVASPCLMMLLRVCQGLGFGGEFGSAVTYIAEHARPDQRGLATGAFAITSACGLVLSILVVLATELVLGKTAFEAWGWRIPFLFSAVLMLISVRLRLRLQESPLFLQLRADGRVSAAPLREAFGTRRYLRTSLIALFGAIAGNSVALAVAAYPIYFLMLNLRVDPLLLDYTILGYSVLLALFILGAAWLSDHVGRKPLMLAGFMLTALACFPVFKAITHYADPGLEAAIRVSPVRVLADPTQCSLQIDPIGVVAPRTSCDIAHKALAKAGVPYTSIAVPGQPVARVEIGATRLESFESRGLSKPELATRTRAFGQELTAALSRAGYPVKADPRHTNVVALILWIGLLCLFVALASGPLASWLVEMFPTRIRGTALSLPYNLGGWFGGFLPAVVFSVFTSTGDFYSGLWYAIGMLALATLIAAVCLPETRGRSLVAID